MCWFTCSFISMSFGCMSSRAYHHHKQHKHLLSLNRHSLTHSLTRALMCSRNRQLTHSHTQSQPLTHPFVQSLARSHTHLTSLTYSRTRSLTHSHTRSFTHTFPHPPTHTHPQAVGKHNRHNHPNVNRRLNVSRLRLGLAQTTTR